MNVQELMVRLRLDSQQFNSGMTQSTNVLRKMDLGAKALQKSMEFAALGGIAFMAKQAVSAVWDLGRMGAMTIQAADAFEELARQAGGSADQVLAAVRRAADGTITDSEIIASVNKGILLGLGAQADQWEQLAEVARFRARAMGMTMTQALNDISMGIGRESRLILDNLGIILDIDQATQAYAATLNKTADQLTAFERKQAIMTAVIAEGQEQIRQAGGMVLTDAERMMQLDAAFKTLKETIAVSLAPALGALAEAATDALTALREAGEETKKEMIRGDIFADAATEVFNLAKAAQFLGITIQGMPPLEFVERQDLTDAQQLAAAYYALKGALDTYGISAAGAVKVGRELSGAASAIMAPLVRTIEFYEGTDLGQIDLGEDDLVYNLNRVDSELLNLYDLLRGAETEAQRVQFQQLIDALQRVQTEAHAAGIYSGDYYAVLRRGAVSEEEAQAALEERLAALHEEESLAARAAAQRVQQAAALRAQAEEYRTLADLARELGRQDVATVLTEQMNELYRQLGEMVPPMEEVVSSGREMESSIDGAASAVRQLDQAMAANVALIPEWARVATAAARAFVDIKKDLASVDLEEVTAGFASATDQLTSRLGRLSESISLAKAEEIYGRYLAALEDLYRDASQMTELELAYRRNQIDESFDQELEIIEKAGEEQGRALETIGQQYSELRGLVSAALQPTDVTALDMQMTAMGTYVDKWDESARRLAAIAARGFAELAAHPDWAGALKIPPEILAGNEEALKEWARRTAGRVRELFRPDLLNIGAAADAVEQYIRDVEAREISIDLVIAELERRGVSTQQARQQVLEMYGLEKALPVTLDLAPGAAQGLADQIGTVSVPILPAAPEEGGLAGALVEQMEAEEANLIVAGADVSARLAMGITDAFTEASVGQSLVSQLQAELKAQAEALRNVGRSLWGLIEEGFSAAMRSSEILEEFISKILPLIIGRLQRAAVWGGGGGEP